MSDKPVGRVVWIGADLRGVSLDGVSLRHADLRAADLRGVSFNGMDLSYADFRGAQVQGASFENANLYGAKMQGVEAFQANFRGANLQLTNMGGAYLEGATLPPPTAAKPRQLSPSEIASEAGPAGQAPPAGIEQGRGKGNGRR